MKQHYNASFYKDRRTKTVNSARAVLPLVFDLFEVSSMVDFGCGSGTWLSVARELGVNEVLGIEGAWVEESYLDDPEISVLSKNLDERIALDKKYDLAMSLEVAEHLSKRRAASFVDDLCDASNRVLFSAAIPNQGGQNHINEQWQSYWAKLFQRRNYRPLDVIRPLIWDNNKIPYWYRQNTLLYICESEYKGVLESMYRRDREDYSNLDVVHPTLYSRRTVDLGLKTRIKIAMNLPSLLMRELLTRVR